MTNTTVGKLLDVLFERVGQRCDARVTVGATSNDWSVTAGLNSTCSFKDATISPAWRVRQVCGTWKAPTRV